jgi:hypothetical protein
MLSVDKSPELASQHTAWAHCVLQGAKKMNSVALVLVTVVAVFGCHRAFAQCSIEQIQAYFMEAKSSAPAGSTKELTKAVSRSCNQRTSATSCTLPTVVRKLADGMTLTAVQRECML